MCCVVTPIANVLITLYKAIRITIIQTCDKHPEAGFNPCFLKSSICISACFFLSQVWMIVILIALYNVINTFAIGVTTQHINDLLYFGFLKLDLKETVNTTFFYLNLAKPDPFYILAVLSGIFQFFSSKMMAPYVEAGESAALKTKDKSDDIAYNMQEQMLYLMPLMTVIIGLKLPAGAVLYILVTTIFSLVQQYFVSGWGGLTPWIKKIAVYGKKAR